MLRWATMSAILGCAALTSPVQAQVTLQWKFQVGEKFYLEEVVKHEQDIVAIVNGNEQAPKKMKQKTVNTRISEFVVQEKDNEGYLLEQKVLRWHNVVEGSEPGTNQNQQLEKVLGNSTFTVRIARTGAVVDFGGYDAFMKQVQQSSPGELKLMRDILTREALRSPLALAFDVLSRREVKPGDRWQKTLTIPMGPIGNCVVQSQFTYRGETKGLDELAVKGDFSFQPPREDVDAGVLKITKLELKSSGLQGTVLFDRMSGRLVRRDLTMPISGTMTMESAGSQLDMTLDGTETRSIRLLKNNPLAGEP
jgi:Family of unknown function (DUF6263)